MFFTASPTIDSIDPTDCSKRFSPSYAFNLSGEVNGGLFIKRYLPFYYTFCKNVAGGRSNIETYIGRNATINFSIFDDLLRDGRPERLVRAEEVDNKHPLAIGMKGLVPRAQYEILKKDHDARAKIGCYSWTDEVSKMLLSSTQCIF